MATAAAAATVASYATIASTAIGVVQQQVSMSQQRKAAKAQAAQAAAGRQLKLDQETLQQRLKEKQLERERRSAVASARARLGASGVGSTIGSGAAVIGGLDKNYNEALVDSRKGYDMTVSGLNLLNDPVDIGGGGAAQGLALAQGVLGLGKQVAGVLEQENLQKATTSNQRKAY